MKERTWGTALVGLASGPALAGEGVGPGAAESLSVLMALLLVLALILGLAWLLRRSGLVASRAGSLQVLASLPLGGRERAVLVQLGEEQWLLGVAPGSVRMLARLDRPLPEDAPETGGFALRLRQRLAEGDAP